MSRKSVLFVATHYPDRAPGQRYRFEQYMDYLRSNGFDCELHYIISKETDTFFYKPGNYLKKLLAIVGFYKTRWSKTRSLDNYDIIFIFREALLTRHIFFERAAAKSRAKVIFDFDDAIWMPNISEANRLGAFLKNPAKTEDLIRLSDGVFAGNTYLANYARQFSNNVAIVPTTIDTDWYTRKPVPNKPAGKVCIGWTGSITTLAHFQEALPALREIKRRFGDKVYFKLIGSGDWYDEILQVGITQWRSDTEVEDLSELDIGLMPLPNEEWTEGKCGCKGLQYMALEIPTLMSPRGVNKDIIADGQNGYLCEETDQWVQVLSDLVENAELRQRIGRAGRQTVVDHYSVASQRDRYVKAFRNLLAGKDFSDV